MGPEAKRGASPLHVLSFRFVFQPIAGTPKNISTQATGRHLLYIAH